MKQYRRLLIGVAGMFFLMIVVAVINPLGTTDVWGKFKRYIKVKVVNDMTMPVPVVLKGGTKEAWTASTVLTFDATSATGCSGVFYTVPEGKQLLIKFASGFGPNHPVQGFLGDRYAAYLQVTFSDTVIGSGPNPKAIHFDVVSPSDSNKLVRFGQQVDLPLGGGSQIDYCVNRSGILSASETLVGVLNGVLMEVG